MKLQVNSHILRTSDGDFKHGKVLFNSIVSNHEAVNLPLFIRVNLSKSGSNPNCDTPIRRTQDHNEHAGLFQSYTAMREYINRVTADVHAELKTHNLALALKRDGLVDHVVVEDNDDLAYDIPIPILDEAELLFLHLWNALGED